MSNVLKPGDEEYLRKYARKFLLGHLFFTHIRGTALEAQGWTGVKLAQYLEAEGFIQIYRRQGSLFDRPGVKVEVPMFAWLPGKQIKREELVAHMLKRRIA